MRTPRSLFTWTLCLLVPVALGLAPGAAADHAYEESTMILWDTPRLDVLVLGVDDPVLMAAIEQGIAAWEQAVDQLAEPWLANAFELRVYAPGSHPLPPPGFQPDDIEIYVVPQGFMAATKPDFFGAGQQCVATAPYLGNDAGADRDALYRTAAHEFGHCLGLAHAYEHGIEYAPSFDLMGGADADAKCPSNLNIQVLERVYGGAFGRPSGGTIVMSASDYVQSDCAASLL